MPAEPLRRAVGKLSRRVSAVQPRKRAEQRAATGASRNASPCNTSSSAAAGSRGRSRTSSADRRTAVGDPRIVPVGFHVEMQRRAARRRVRAALPAAQLGAALAELPKRRRSDLGRCTGASRGACSSASRCGRTRCHADAAATGRNQGRMPARFHDELSWRDARRPRRRRLSAAQCLAAVAGLPERACRGHERRDTCGCRRSSTRACRAAAAARAVPAAACTPRAADEPVSPEISRRRPYRPAASPRSARSA